MWYLKELEIDGLMSFGEAKIEFNQSEVTIIYGKNLDTGDDKSNASGKSTILEGVGFGITGSQLRKIKIGELVNDEKKEAFVKVTLLNDGLNECMEIHRTAFRRKSSVCQVFVGEIGGKLSQVEKLTSTDHANKFISEKIGIVKEDLLNFFILMASQFTPFLDASDTKKKEVINRFSNGVIVDNAIETLETDMGLCSEELSEISSQLSSMESTFEALNSTLNETIRLRDDNDSDNEIESIERMIETRSGLLAIKREDLSELKLDLIDVNEEISEAPNSKELEKQLEPLLIDKENSQSKISDLKSKISLLKHEIKEIKVKINGSISCPKCSHDFDPTSPDFDLDKAKNDLLEKTVEHDKILAKGILEKKNLESVNENIISINNRMIKINSRLIKLNSEKNDIENDISKIIIDIKSDEAKIEAYHLKIDALSSKEEVDTVTPLINKLNSIGDKIKPLKVKNDEVESELNDYKIQLDVFKRFKSHLANLSLKSMEGLANDFLEDFGSDIFLQLNAEKKLANGKSKEKIDATLVRHGVDIGSFNKRSGGERAAINLAFAKTLSHLINLNAGENKGLNLLVVDEILDATDAEGLIRIIKSFEKSGDTVILISHTPLPDSVGTHITVCKENDLSRIL